MRSVTLILGLLLAAFSGCSRSRDPRQVLVQLGVPYTTEAWLDHAGLFPTTTDDRAVQIHWPNPMPSPWAIRRPGRRSCCNLSTICCA